MSRNVDLTLRGRVVGTFASEAEAQTVLDKIVAVRSRRGRNSSDPSFGYAIAPSEPTETLAPPA